MLLALDYDNTYTQDPVLWDGFILAARSRGHAVKIVTMRYPSEPVEVPGVDVVYTSRQAKKHFMAADVWIDDTPAFIFQDAL
jgi:hypothetical protein